MSYAFCSIELSLEKAKSYRKDLKSQKIQALVFVDRDEKRIDSLKKFYEEEKNVFFFLVQTAFDLELISQAIAWKTVALLLRVELGQDLEFWSFFIEKVKKFQLQANLLLSDSSDFGVAFFKEALAKDETKKVRNGLFLKNRFLNYPAIIVGAGPSLQQDLEKLKEFEEKALIFAGGNALLAIDQAPHFAALIDAKDLSQEIKQFAYPETPFLFSSRTSSAHCSFMKGDAVWFPDAHHLFLNYLALSDPSLFDGGWTVATFMTKIALFLGCSPIILVGVDLCYEKGIKYGHRPNDPSLPDLVEIEEGGIKKLTQPDWQMTRDWFCQMSHQEKKVEWIDARRGKGLDLGDLFEKKSLDELALLPLKDLREQVASSLISLPYLKPLQNLEKWKESLLRCQKRVDFSGIDQVDESFLLQFDQEEDYEEEVVYDYLLKPMWNLWKPLYERQMQKEDKIGLHRALFFGQIIEEHLRAMQKL